MDRIEDLQAFVAIVEKGSLTGAARQLGRSLQSVSRSLAALEGGLGVELVRRTTRRSTPTEVGLAFHRRLSEALAEVEAAKLEASNRHSEVTGLLRITSSTAFAPLYVVPAVCAFHEAHPKLDIELGCLRPLCGSHGRGHRSCRPHRRIARLKPQGQAPDKSQACRHRRSALSC